MSDVTDRARRLRERRRRPAERGERHLVADETAVQALLAPEPDPGARARDAARVGAIRWGGLADPDAVDGLLDELRASHAAERIAALVAANRRTVLDAIVGPFGLGSVVALADKRGGAVLTRQTADRAVAEGWADETADPERVAAYGRQRAGHGYDHGAHEAGLGARRKARVQREALRRTTQDAAIAGARAAGNMAVQQALGRVLLELADACLDEALALWGERHRSRSLGEWGRDLADRLQRVASRVAERWEDAADAFKTGALSGLLASLATTLANLFVSTGKRLVRILREGLHALLKAGKLLYFPPDDMTPAQAAHAASKLFTAAISVTVGIGVEEGVEKAIAAAPALAPFANGLSNVLVGIATGLSTAWLVRQIDRLDLFGVEAESDQARLLAALDERVAGLLACLESDPQPA